MVLGSLLCPSQPNTNINISAILITARKRMRIMTPKIVVGVTSSGERGCGLLLMSFPGPPPRGPVDHELVAAATEALQAHEKLNRKMKSKLKDSNYGIWTAKYMRVSCAPEVHFSIFLISTSHTHPPSPIICGRRTLGTTHCQKPTGGLSLHLQATLSRPRLSH